MSDLRPCDGCGVETSPDQLVTLAGRSVCARCKPDVVMNLKSGVVSGERIDPAKAEEIRKRISRLNLMSFALALPGFLLMVGGPAAIAAGSGSSTDLVIVLTVLRFAGTGLLIGGFAAYAMMKGRSPAFALLGLASCIGLVVLAVIGKKCLNCRTEAGSRSKECRACGAPM